MLTCSVEPTLDLNIHDISPKALFLLAAQRWMSDPTPPLKIKSHVEMRSTHSQCLAILDHSLRYLKQPQTSCPGINTGGYCQDDCHVSPTGASRSRRGGECGGCRGWGLGAERGKRGGCPPPPHSTRPRLRPTGLRLSPSPPFPFRHQTGRGQETQDLVFDQFYCPLLKRCCCTIPFSCDRPAPCR